jgi:chromosome partitioning protein
MRTVVFANQKGGPGKSTLAVLYAHWLADRQHERVCVIDLDTQRNATKTLQAFDAGVGAAALFDDTRTPLPVPSHGLALFHGSPALIELERARPADVIPAFRRNVTSLAGGFDACVVDTPPAVGVRMSAALIAAHHVVCPIELEEYSIDGVTEMLKTVFGVRQKYNPALQLAGIVANRFNPHSIRQREALTGLIARYGDFLVPAKISTRAAIPEALAAGVPVWRLAKSSAREASAEVLHVFELLQQRMRTAASQESAA